MAVYNSSFTGSEIDARLTAVGSEFVASTAYPIGSLTLRNGVLYQKTSGNTTEAWNASHWTQVSLTDVGGVDNTLTETNKAADAKVTGDEIGELKSEISEITESTKNLWNNGNVSVESDGYTQLLLKTPLEAGTYTLSCVCTSQATNVKYSYIRLATAQDISGGIPSANFIQDVPIAHDGNRQSYTFTLSQTAYSVRFLSSNTVGNSSGNTAEFTDIQVESGSSATPYVLPVSAVDRFALRAMGFATSSDDLDTLPSNSIVGVLSSSIPSNYPLSIGSEVISLSHRYNGNGTTIVQMCIPFNRTANTKIYLRTQVNYVWSDWQAIETDPNYIGYDLYPTGDTTERGLEIVAVLALKKTCRLAPGNYYVNAMAMQEGTELIGCGNATKIIRASNATYNYMLRLKKDCKLRNLALVGSLTDITVTNNWHLYNDTPAICAVRIEGTGSDNTQRFRAEISDVSISSFEGSAIFIHRTGYHPEGGCHINNVFVRNCNAGIALGQYAEFHRITGCGFFECYYGAVNNGGNNVFENCDFSTNVQGLLMDNSRGLYSNSSHGSFVGCSFNHSDSNNGTAIELNTMIAGEMFVGCNIFYGAIILTASNGVVFNACNIGSQTPITITDGGGVQFANCVFRGGQTTVTDNRPDKTHFDNCYYLNGTAVSGTPA